MLIKKPMSLLLLCKPGAAIANFFTTGNCYCPSSTTATTATPSVYRCCHRRLLLPTTNSNSDHYCMGRVLARRHMNIYTKTGDKGTSALFSGERRKKSDLRFQALGATDELTSSIGLSIAFAEESNHKCVVDLIKIQCILQDIGSFIATPSSSARESHTNRLHFDPEQINMLEKAIDEMTAELPPLTNFILPSGGKTSSSLHLSRAVCRRAERHLVELLFAEEINENVYKYINRLSDYLFTLARYVAMIEGKKEHIYRSTKKS